MTPRHLLQILVLASLASCAYYNGLYNAKDLAHRAEKAERDGRPFDAQTYWGQAAVKAETVLAHHPNSRWTEEARWLDGKALERLGNCTAAMAPLQRTLREARDPARADDAALRLAACQEKLGDPDGAGLSVERLLDNADPAIRREARWRAGTTYRRTGRSAEAVRVLRSSGHPRARGELAAALADNGDASGAAALADSLLQEGDSLAPWGAIFRGVGRLDPVASSRLLDLALATGRFPRDSAATWLAADGARWLARDSARAFDRLAAAHHAAPEREAGLDALLTSFRLRLATSSDPAILDTVGNGLDDIPVSAGSAYSRALALDGAATLARARFDSIAPSAPRGDLMGFLLGESLRDSLGAPRLAGIVWRRMIADHPTSPYVPKALLALAAVGAAPADSVRTVLDAQFAASPYVLALHGTADSAYRSLEDSLWQFGRSLSAPTRRGRGTPPRGRPSTGRPVSPVQ